MFLFWNQCCDLTCTWVLRIVRRVSATTIRELWKGKVYHSHVLEGTRYMLGDTVMSWMKEREFGSVQFTQSSLSLCDLVDSTPGFPVHHQLPELTQTHVHWFGDAIQPSNPLSSFSSCPQSLPASESFQMSQLLASGGQRHISKLWNTWAFLPSLCIFYRGRDSAE